MHAVHVKWPNDIVCKEKKISGTLIEVQAESHGMSHAVIGIGLNVNMLIDERRRLRKPGRPCVNSLITIKIAINSAQI